MPRLYGLPPPTHTHPPHVDAESRFLSSSPPLGLARHPSHARRARGRMPLQHDALGAHGTRRRGAAAEIPRQQSRRVLEVQRGAGYYRCKVVEASSSTFWNADPCRFRPLLNSFSTVLCHRKGSFTCGHPAPSTQHPAPPCQLCQFFPRAKEETPRRVQTGRALPQHQQ